VWGRIGTRTAAIVNVESSVGIMAMWASRYNRGHQTHVG
jgi:hypothetical protein